MKLEQQVNGCGVTMDVNNESSHRNFKSDCKELIVLSVANRKSSKILNVPNSIIFPESSKN